MQISFTKSVVLQRSSQTDIGYLTRSSEQFFLTSLPGKSTDQGPLGDPPPVKVQVVSEAVPELRQREKVKVASSAKEKLTPVVVPGLTSLPTEDLVAWKKTVINENDAKTQEIIDHQFLSEESIRQELTRQKNVSLTLPDEKEAQYELRSIR